MATARSSPLLHHRMLDSLRLSLYYSSATLSFQHAVFSIKNQLIDVFFAQNVSFHSRFRIHDLRLCCRYVSAVRCSDVLV
jgi:hypothetical protein